MTNTTVKEERRKRAVAQALEIAAKRLGITPEEFLQRAVKNLPEQLGVPLSPEKRKEMREAWVQAELQYEREHLDTVDGD